MHLIRSAHRQYELMQSCDSKMPNFYTILKRPKPDENVPWAGALRP